MYRLFYISLISIFIGAILFANIAYTFNMLNFLNPSALNISPDSYSNYYFGFSSFIEAFETFGEESVLNDYQLFLVRFGNRISDYFYLRSSNGKIWGVLDISKASGTGGILVTVITIALLLISGAPLLLLVAYGVLWLFFILVYAITLAFFVISFFSGSFRTPLPETYDFSEPDVVYSLKALMV